jgi:hypothetical protein
VAIVVPVLLASTLLYPQVLNPDWTDGTPETELRWLAGLVASTSLVAVAAWVSSIRVGPVDVRVVNPWGTLRLPRSEIVAVRPGPFGVELLTHEQRHVAFAVQCTVGYLGARPRWVDVAEAITGREPEWREPDEDVD